jgi:hypothetical protein
VLLLDRRPAGPARFRDAMEAEALSFLVEQNIAIDRRPDEIIERFHALMASARCLRLEYSDLDEAAALIMRSFAHWPADIAMLPPAPGPAAATPPMALPLVPADARFARRPGIGARRVDGDLFLTDAATRRIHRMNTTGGIVWALLESAMAMDDLTDALKLIFPDVTEDRLRADLGALLAALLADGLVAVAGSEAGGHA